MEKNLQRLKLDFDSSQSPQWYDKHTTDTLDDILNDISHDRLTWSEFQCFVNENFGQGDFAWGCLQYVRKNL